MQTLMDAGLGAWIALVVGAMFWTPLLMRVAAASPGELAGRTLLWFSLLVPLAAAANLFNWVTALMLCGASAIAASDRVNYRGRLRSLISADKRGWFRASGQSLGRGLLDRRFRTAASLALLAATQPVVQAVLNTRLPSSDEYFLLASTHRLLSDEWLGMPLPGPSLVAMVSAVSAADPLQVVRFLKPALHVGCAVSIAALVRLTTAQRYLAWLTGAMSGLLLLPVQSSLDLLALTTLFGGLAMLYRARRGRGNAVAACGILAMSVLTVPALGTFVAAAAAVVLGGPTRYVPEGVGLVLLLAALVEPHLFDSVASLAPCLFAGAAGLACRRLVREPLRAAGIAMRATPFSRAVLAAPALAMLVLPNGMYAEYLEPDSAARQALALKRSRVSERWAVIGAEELRVQFASTAPVMDLQEFVARYGASAGSAYFRFNVPADRLYVFIEKRPIVAPQTGLSRRSTELDRAVYRIPRLRAELHRAALELCEAYRRTHAGATVHYEDEDLRIYAFAL